MPSPGNNPTHRIETFDLSIARIGIPGVAPPMAGRSLTVMALDGLASIQFDDAAGPVHDLRECDAFVGEDFGSVLITNAAQPGKTLTLRASWEATR